MSEFYDDGERRDRRSPDSAAARDTARVEVGWREQKGVYQGMSEEYEMQLRLTVCERRVVIVRWETIFHQNAVAAAISLHVQEERSD